MSTPFRLRVPRPLLQQLLAQAVAELPNECCGLLAGIVEGASDSGSAPADRPLRFGRAMRRYPLVNAAASPTEYLSDAQSLLAAHKDMRRLGLEILAVYHSHPTSEPVPSRTDLARNYYEDAVHLIVSLQTGTPTVRGWWLAGNQFREVDWEVIEEGERGASAPCSGEP